MTDQDRRRYRFRAWSKRDRAMFDVISMARGGVVLEDNKILKTCPREAVELMQFSGLVDEADTEIYEGDKVRLPNGKAVAKVVFEDGAFRLEADPGSDFNGCVLDDVFVSKNKLKVVGHIYED